MKSNPVLSVVPEETGQGLKVSWRNGDGITRNCAAFLDEGDSPVKAAKVLIDLAGHVLEEISVDHDREGR